MVIYFKTGTHLRENLKPDIDFYTRKVDTKEGLTILEIIKAIDLDVSEIAFACSDNTVKKLDYRPAEGEIITLLPQISGG
ncbi:MAG: hypothetical protein JW737_00335 [Acidobacteria bacterium]|nr:hypothetical protein [Acidobacteriota bacterium]